MISPVTALAGAFFIWGCYFITCGSWLLGSLSIGLAFVRGFLHKGIEFNLTRSRYRLYKALFHFRLGNWEPLPVVTGMTVKYFSDLITSSRLGLMRTDKDLYLIVMLSVQSSATGIILERFPLPSEAFAFEFAQQIANFLAVPVRSHRQPA